MSINNLLTLIRSNVTSPFLALFLYGSYARGDYDEESDIDVIQVTEVHTAPYSVGQTNVTCYTPHQLLTLAKTGSLFAKHIVSEAIAIEDPNAFLEILKTAYLPPKDYRHLYAQLSCAAPLVAIDKAEFDENRRHYSATATYLLRSYDYARAMELGAWSFSAGHITEITGDVRPREYIRELKRHEEYDQFNLVVNLFFELLGVARVNRQQSLEAFVVNSYERCELGAVLGLRILARGNLLTYVFTEQDQ